MTKHMPTKRDRIKAAFPGIAVRTGEYHKGKPVTFYFYDGGWRTEDYMMPLVLRKRAAR